MQANAPTQMISAIVREVALVAPEGLHDIDFPEQMVAGGETFQWIEAPSSGSTPFPGAADHLGVEPRVYGGRELSGEYSCRWLGRPAGDVLLVRRTETTQASDGLSRSFEGESLLAS